MNTSKYITAVVGNEKITTAEPITRVDYGLRLKIKGISLPDTYEVDFSKSEEGGESVTVIGDADGAEIPLFLIKTGKDIYAWLYWVGEGYGKRVKKIMIPNDAGPERTDIVPEPAEQSVIDQTIAKLNEAVEHAPKIGEDGYWYVYDAETGGFVSTGTQAEAEDGLSIYFSRNDIVVPHDGAGNVKEHAGAVILFKAFKGSKRVNCGLNRIQGLGGTSTVVVRTQDSTAEQTGLIELAWPAGEPVVDQQADRKDFFVYLDVEGKTLEFNCYMYFVRDGAGYVLTEEDKQEIADMVDIPLVVEDGMLCAVYETEEENK